MFWLALIIAYLLGSISTAYILGWLIKKVDIRTIGSKNAGATNAYMSLGKAAGIFTGVFDAIKGILAFWIAYLLMQSYGFPIFWVFLSGFLAIAGHNWPFYLQFKGGKGAATAYGLLMLSFAWIIINYKLNMWLFIGIGVAALVVLFSFKTPRITYFVFAPIFMALVIFYIGFVDWTWFILFLMVYLYIITIITFGKEGR